MADNSDEDVQEVSEPMSMPGSTIGTDDASHIPRG